MERDNDNKFVMCPKCGLPVDYQKESVYWNEGGYGYSTKLVDCDRCNVPIVIEYVEDDWMKEYCLD